MCCSYPSSSSILLFSAIPPLEREVFDLFRREMVEEDDVSLSLSLSRLLSRRLCFVYVLFLGGLSEIEFFFVYIWKLISELLCKLISLLVPTHLCMPIGPLIYFF